jgi:hypothetical protein
MYSPINSANCVNRGSERFESKLNPSFGENQSSLSIRHYVIISERAWIVAFSNALSRGEGRAGVATTGLRPRHRWSDWQRDARRCEVFAS